MPSIANVTLTDAASTPVDHTFVPADCTSAKATWEETAISIPIGRPKAELSITETQNTFKVNVALMLPVMETISGDVGGYVAAPQVAYTMTGKAELILPKRSTLQNRKDLKSMFIDFLSDAFVTAAVESQSRAY